MKNLFITLFILIPGLLVAQEYSEVVEVPGKNVDELYTTAREWFAVTYKSANDVLQMDDPVAGVIIGKGAMHVTESYVAGKGLYAAPIKLDWYPSFTLKVAIREGRYKYDITNINVSAAVASFGNVENPFEMYLDKKDYFKNGSDAKWVIANPPEGMKVGKAMAKNLAQANAATYNLIVKTQNELDLLIKDLKETMQNKTSDENW